MKDRSINVTYFQLLYLAEFVCMPLDLDFDWAKMLKQMLCEQIKQRIDYMTNELNDQFSPVYIIATYLSPNLHQLLDKNLRILAEKHLKQRLIMGTHR